MTLNEFALLVQSMRNSQKEYFTGRSNAVLRDCKRMEKLVDEAVKEIVSQVANPPRASQAAMFNEPKTEDTSYEEVKS